MKGLELSEKYYNEVLKEVLEKFDVKMAVGLMGYGSECYGYDDNISKDHDFSAMPAILLKEEDYFKYKDEIEEKLNELPKEFMGNKVLDTSCWGKNRRGVLNLNDYVYSFLGSENPPTKDIEYRNIPQYLLSAFTNGKIFKDEIGFEKIREKVKFYPNDIRLNMIATRCMNINSTYVNYERCIKRSMKVPASLALSQFITNVIEMYFLIYKKYCPYYKWQHKMFGEYNPSASNLIEKLVDESTSTNARINIMDKLCSDIIDKLEEQDIIIRIADFIGYYGDVIQSRIENEEIKNLGCWRD